MGKQKHTAEQIISKLREAEVLQAKGMSMEERVMRQLGAIGKLRGQSHSISVRRLPRLRIYSKRIKKRDIVI